LIGISWFILHFWQV